MQNHDEDACHRAIQTALLFGNRQSKDIAIRVASRMAEFTKFLVATGLYIRHD